MPFCYAPWTNIDIDPQGYMSPCCKFRHELYHYSKHNIIASDLDSYKNSKLLQEIKQDFLNDDWPKGCQRCQIEEENSIDSKRQLDFTRWQEYYNTYNLENDGFLTASVAFGNTCNLKCITCNADTSSRWYQEYKLIYGAAQKPNHFYKNGFVQDLVSQCDNLIHLDIGGGEPLLSGIDQQHELLDYYIDTGQAKNISIHYTTNVTEYPSQLWWDKWKHFKEIDIQLSIDGIGNRHEYIRFPASWPECEQNVDRYLQAKNQIPNLRLSVSHTLSAYNIYYLDEFFSWCEQKHLPLPWVGRVNNPKHLRLSVYPDQVKQLIITHLKTSKFQDVLTWADLLGKSDDSRYFSEFVKRTKQHDNYRHLNFDEIFPELAQLMKKYS